MQSVKSVGAECESHQEPRVPSGEPMVATSVLNPNRTAQVVIVGAGLAGLAAAQRLHKLGINDIIILDALDRIGGRVHTINHSNYLLELGAQWLHGADENPLYKWLVDKNLLDDFEDASLGFSGLFCTNKGQRVDQSLVKKVLDIVIDGKLSLSKNKYNDIIENSGNEFKNAGQVFKYLLDSKIESDEQLLANKLLVYALFDWFLRYETIENCCDSMDEVSITSYTDWTDWGDGTLLNFKHGYRSLLHWFCQQISNCIHLNKQVTNVELLKKASKLTDGTDSSSDDDDCWLDDQGNQFKRPIVVRYVDNNNPTSVDNIVSKTVVNCNPNPSRTKLIECNHVIVTASLGFLKSNHETFFKPQLAEVKRDLIESIGFGTVNKIVLQFDSPFWNDDHGIKLVWEDRDKEKFPTWVHDVTAFDVVRRQPNLLIGWIGGHGAKLMEAESNSSIGETCLQVLEKFLPPSYNKPTKLIECFCSRWNSNPFIRGSYSFQSMRSFDQKVDKLHEPIYHHSSSPSSSAGDNNNTELIANAPGSRVPRILFAGEATAGKLYSTTHGAIITGWREADRLHDHLSLGNKANIQQQVAATNTINSVVMQPVMQLAN